MRSNAGMANRQGDVDLRFTQVSTPQLTLWLGLAFPEMGRFAGETEMAGAIERCCDVERRTEQMK